MENSLNMPWKRICQTFSVCLSASKIYSIRTAQNKLNYFFHFYQEKLLFYSHVTKLFSQGISDREYCILISSKVKQADDKEIIM